MLERLVPWREQKLFRKYLIRDVFFLIFNGEIFGSCLAVLLYQVAGGLSFSFARIEIFHPLQSLSFPVQVLVFLVCKDFIEYWIHRLLHRYPLLWYFHGTHHTVSIMDFWCNFRFHWMEIVVYKTLGYAVPLLLGVPWKVVLISALIATLIGHLNHSNLAFSYGPLRYVLNHPKMHIWHHEVEPDQGGVKNFGVVFSAWDFLFKTAYINDEKQPKIGLAPPDDLLENKAMDSLSWSLSAICVLYYCLFLV
jgi:sterol desaturase/sphingolipid hydroxylase (fatty acid hydroxylase superfamily)